MDWLKDLINLCMGGVILYDPDDERRLVDFVIPTDDGVVIANVGWWDPRITGGTFTSHIVYLPGAAVHRTDSETRFEIRHHDKVYDLYTPEDSIDIEAAERHRLATDLQRYEYTGALELASEVIEGKQFIDWMVAYLTRPRVTLQSLRRQEMTQLRKAGTITRVDGDGVAVDVLVFDQTGQAATAGIDNWLEGMARVWTDLEPADRPTLRDFADRLEGQGYADKYLTKAGEVEARGTLASIASTLLA